MISEKEKYIYATGRRKTAVARVRVYNESEKKPGIFVNDMDLYSYFSNSKSLVEKIYSPLVLLDIKNKYFISVKVLGGGINGQAEAIRLGISRALLDINEDYRKNLKVQGFLTRDSRKVERKKPGLKKARRSPQWKKR